MRESNSRSGRNPAFDVSGSTVPSRMDGRREATEIGSCGDADGKCLAWTDSAVVVRQKGVCADPACSSPVVTAWQPNTQKGYSGLGSR